MLNCKTGEDFERLVLDTLQTLNFEAHQTGREDRGVDIIAFKTVDGHRYRFDIQCKFWNTTVGMKPIQEVYAGSHYFNQGGTPVVFTNNRVTLIGEEERINDERECTIGDEFTAEKFLWVNLKVPFSKLFGGFENSVLLSV